MGKVSFIGIGAQKCASTWIYRVLKEHPDICLSEEKELDFFSCKYNQGYQWYESHFTACNTEFICGEVSPSYFCEPAVPERVYKYNRETKIILTLRDPIERAISNHMHELRLGHFTGADLSFEAGILNNPMYLEQGMYAKHLAKWIEYFPIDQIYIVLVDDIRKNKETIITDLYKFLGVDSDYMPISAGKHYNRSYMVRYQWLGKIKDLIYSTVNNRALLWIWKVGTMLGLRGIYRILNKTSSNRVIPDIQEQTLESLRSNYRPEILRLEKIIKRSLHEWD